MILIDSTRLKFLAEDEWKRKKISLNIVDNGPTLQIGIDAETLQIRSVQLTTNNVSDSQELSDLVHQIAKHKEVDSVFKDGAYDTKD